MRQDYIFFFECHAAQAKLPCTTGTLLPATGVLANLQKVVKIIEGEVPYCFFAFSECALAPEFPAVLKYHDWDSNFGNVGRVISLEAG